MTTIFFILIFVILAFDFILERVLAWLNSTYWNDKLPAELEGIYDQEKYRKSQQYEKHKNKFSLVLDSLTFLVMVVVLLAGGFAWVDHVVRGWTQNPILMAI